MGLKRGLFIKRSDEWDCNMWKGCYKVDDGLGFNLLI